MSFSQNIKTELCKITRKNDKTMQACLLGMLVFLRQNSDRTSIVFNTENEDSAYLFEELIGVIVGSDISVFTSTKTRNNGTTVIQKRIDNPLEAKRVYDYFINLADCDLNTLDSSYFYCDDITLGAFFRGAFLVAGSITNPKKEYHIELSASTKELADSALKKLTELGFSFKISKRNAKYVIYSKDSETLEDFLTFTGATDSTLEIMNVKVAKEITNKLNRITNCENANLNKTLDASKRQIADITYVLEHKNQVELSDEMLEIAELKLDDPEASLRELASMISTPITRSGVNHRLQKFTKIASELREENGDVYEEGENV